MLTWYLWQALYNPPQDNPLFQRAVTAQSVKEGSIHKLGIFAMYWLACIALTLVWPLLITNAPTLLVILIAAGNTIYGTAWAASISATIARERETDTYDLLCLLPPGAPGADWILSTACLYRSSLFRQLRLLVRILATALMGALIAAMLIPAVFALTPGDLQALSPSLFLALVYGLTAGAGFYIDHVQSLVLGNVVGMLVSTYTPNRLNARLLAAGLFVLLKLLVYLLVLTLGFEILDGRLESVTLPLVRLFVFYVLHEAVIAALWQVLTLRLETSPHEMRRIIGRP